MSEHTFTALHLFCGLGGMALGFQRARGRWRGLIGRFESLLGIDNDPESCADFEALTGVPALCADVAKMQPDQLARATGGVAPDVVFTSPPCKGFSALLPKKAAAQEKYQALNRLVLQGLHLVLTTWATSPPKLIVLENVPRITRRGAGLLVQLRQLLVAHGYRLHESTHDCGELGGLAQHRRRFLFIARHEASLPTFVYQPPTRAVRAIGDVLEALPLPDAAEAGPLHRLPRLQWKTWVRLALIPAGGDWRDLPEGSYVKWTEASGAVTCGGTPSSSGICDGDPRLGHKPRRGAYRIVRWGEPAPTVTGAAGVGRSCAYAVGDPRLSCTPRAGTMGVLPWDGPSGAVTGTADVHSARTAIAAPRIPTDRERPDPPPVIIALDGTWHRPLTTLELAALQGLPTRLPDGSPLRLAGKSDGRWRQRIGNAVPPPAAQAIGEALLASLLPAVEGVGFVFGGTSIWV